ncbi:hypothetical protein MLD38_013129 [Melastoma candidum]|uniref:Uncharacterized protein n=1 Tax=Melastoma candidum TaxID=119954 RepID=A0ACB9R8M4_9MYRT|nr:hypothetical protein MLD38_013129 [Melastoma candidum]
MVCVFVIPPRCKVPYGGLFFPFPWRKDNSGSVPHASLRREGPRLVCYASLGNGKESQLKVLDSYFDKLLRYRGGDRGILGLKGGPDSPENCLERLDQGGLASRQESFMTRDSRAADDDRFAKLKGLRMSRPRKSPRVPQQLDEPSNVYLISIIASVNIAVFLFEIASPVKSSSLDLFSLPLLYGAKVNDLILLGEWWRLITPMFLHSGILHMGLGCWALATFGTKVCKGYGPFTFLLIYFLGGISGNLTSFLHTPDPTVGGTGPTFAMIGAWLIYQMQNKDELSKEVSEKMFQKAVITTALSFVLSNFGPIDDWTHLGAAVTGIVYGYFTCPTLQMDDASATSSSGQKEGISLVSKPADPCKSLLVFAFVILVFGCLVFFIEPPIGNIVTEDGFS